MNQRSSTEPGALERRTIDIMPLTFVTGALAPAVFGLSFWWSLIAIVLGNVVGALFMALHSAQGPRLGVPQMIQSRAQFGYFGALLVVVVAVAMYVGFFASNLVLGGQSLNQLASGTSVDVGIVICAVVSLVITIFGYDNPLGRHRGLVPDPGDRTAVELPHQPHVEAFFDPSGGPYGRVGGIGIAAYIVGILVEIPFMSTGLYTGPTASAMNGTDPSWIVGLVVTVPLYYLLAVRQRQAARRGPGARQELTTALTRWSPGRRRPGSSAACPGSGGGSARCCPPGCPAGR